LSHHTIRETNPPRPSLTPASDSAARVIAKGQAEMADKLRLRGPAGVKARVAMAMQNALVLALSAEIDAGNINKMDLLDATQTAIGCNMSQAVAMIMVGAPPEVRNAALMMMATNATSFAASAINRDPADIAIVNERVETPRAGAA
jgi:hypothetical protein